MIPRYAARRTRARRFPLRPIACLGLALCALATPARVVAQDAATSLPAGAEWSDAPLRTPVAIPADSFAPDWPQFRAQLSGVTTLDVQMATLLREHLYALISADAKRRAASGATVLPARDATLAEMYAWGARMGVGGADLVATRLSGQAGDTALRTSLPGSFALLLDSAYTLMALDDGWLVRFPHYFMMGPTLREPLESGAVTTVAVLSTLFAADSSSPVGASQATIAIIAAQQDAAEMTAFWLERFGIPPWAVVEPAVPEAVRTYRARVEDMLVNELVVFELPRGTVIFVYSGSSDVFEANRPHFVDVLESLRVRRS